MSFTCSYLLCGYSSYIVEAEYTLQSLQIFRPCGSGDKRRVLTRWAGAGFSFSWSHCQAMDSLHVSITEQCWICFIIVQCECWRLYSSFFFLSTCLDFYRNGDWGPQATQFFTVLPYSFLNILLFQKKNITTQRSQFHVCRAVLCNISLV